MHNSFGKAGEELGAQYLTEKGFTILYKNWRHSHYEIDIIAVKNNVLHFVEVKIRSSVKFGLPEESVTRKKFQNLLSGADEFLFQHPEYRHVQYDILAISRFKKKPIEFFMIEDVYL